MRAGTLPENTRPIKHLAFVWTWPAANHPSLKINLKKDLFLCGPCGKGGKAWALAAFLACLDPGDKPGVTAWLRERGLLDGSTNGSDTLRSATREKKRIAEFYYSADLRKVRLEPGDNDKPKMFVWEHREGDTWKPGDGGKVKLLYVNKIFSTPISLIMPWALRAKRSVIWRENWVSPDSPTKIWGIGMQETRGPENRSVA